MSSEAEILTTAREREMYLQAILPDSYIVREQGSKNHYWIASRNDEDSLVIVDIQINSIITTSSKPVKNALRIHGK